MNAEPPYQTRFIPQQNSCELINYYHLAAVPCGGGNKHARRVQAAKWYHDKHPETSQTAAYKDLDGLLL